VDAVVYGVEGFVRTFVKRRTGLKRGSFLVSWVETVLYGLMMMEESKTRRRSCGRMLMNLFQRG
jgi:hypothetical protein